MCVSVCVCLCVNANTLTLLGATLCWSGSVLLGNLPLVECPLSGAEKHLEGIWERRPEVFGSGERMHECEESPS